MPAFAKDATSKTIAIFIRSAVSSPVGQGLTGLAFNTAGLVLSYQRALGARVAITLVTQTVTGAWASGGFVEIDATNLPGWYRLDVPNAALATGADFAGIGWTGANAIQDGTLIDLPAYDPLAAGAALGTVWDEPRSSHTTAGTFGQGVIVQTNNDKTGVSLAATGLDPVLDSANGVETGMSIRGMWRLLAALWAGKRSGAGTNTEVYRSAVSDSKPRVTVTVDSSGNHTAFTTDQT